MREIKFRAWNGKWMLDSAYGDWVSFDGVPYTECERKYDTPNIEIEKAKGYVLMQYTGLRDKNEKEIYEGDILYDYFADNENEDFSEYKCEVVFQDGCFVVISPGEISCEVLQDHNKTMEVIGNIYEHPELLKNEIH